jgi:hypothetical protein
MKPKIGGKIGAAALATAAGLAAPAGLLTRPRRPGP